MVLNVLMSYDNGWRPPRGVLQMSSFGSVDVRKDALEQVRAVSVKYHLRNEKRIARLLLSVCLYDDFLSKRQSVAGLQYISFFPIGFIPSSFLCHISLHDGRDLMRIAWKD